MKNVTLCVKYEFIKTLWFKKGLIIFAVCFVFNIIFCLFSAPNLYDKYFDTKIYKRYTEQFGGIYSESTFEEIKTELSIQEKIANTPVDEGLSSDELIELSNRIDIARKKVEALKALAEKYEVIKGIKEYNAELTYDIEFSAYAKQFRQDWAALICIAAFTIIIMFGDLRCGIDKLLYSSKIGKRNVIKGKLMTICGLSFLTAMLFSAVRFLIIYSRWDFGDLNIPIQSIEGFENCETEISVVQGLALGYAFQVLFSTATAFLLALFSAIMKNEVMSVSTVTILVGGGALLEDGAFNPSVYLSGISAVSRLNISAVAAVLFVVTAVIAACAAAAYRIQIK